MKSTEIKIAYIGGGSRYWARDLLGELAQTPRLTGSVDLFDLDPAAARKNVEVAAAIFGRPEAKTRFRVRAVRRLSDALKDADFVVISIEPGPTSARYADLEIPARYGIVQPVGDTTGPGGITRALRTIPVFAGFARDIADHCPRAWVINYTNPMTLSVATLYATFPQIKAFGCCHEVFHTQQRLAALAAGWFGAEAEIPRQEIEVELGGINHFTWVTAARWKEHDLLLRLREEIAKPGTFRSRTREADERKRKANYFQSSGLIAIDLLRRFDALGAAGDRHLAEFVPWYAKDEKTLHRWGVPITPYRWRLARAALRDHDVSYYQKRMLKASDEEGVKLIEALAGHATIITNINLPNLGQSVDFAPGHIIESYSQVQRDRVSPLNAPTLPPGATVLVRRAIDVQRLTLKAGLTGDVDLAFQAVLADPLVYGEVDRMWAMFKAMLRHLRSDLPGWRLPA